MFVFFEAIVQNEIWPLGVQSRNQGVAFKNKKQFGRRFYSHKTTYVRVVCFGVFVTIGFGQFWVQANLRKINVQKARVEMTSNREITNRSKKHWFSYIFELRFEMLIET